MIYERQKRSSTQRRCGAAALCMALDMFGRKAEQDRIWDALKTRTPGKENEYRTETYRIARYARAEGLGVLLGRLRDPWRFLISWERYFASSPSALILNHRLRRDSPLGHFSVFSRIDGEKDIVYLHDPQWGPNRSVTKNELLELWQPLGELSEITGHVAIYLTENRATAQNHQCRRCEKTVEIPKLLQFFENWSTMFCPECGAAGLR